MAISTPVCTRFTQIDRTCLLVCGVVRAAEVDE